MEKGSFIPLLRLHSQKRTSKRRFSSVSPATIPALIIYLESNQRPERVSIHTLYFPEERTYLRHQTRYSLFLVKQTILLCYITDEQTNSPWTWSKLKRMTLGRLHPRRPFMVGFQSTKSCHLKACNTFSNFYRKDLTWSDSNNNMYLGPVVVAQQVLDPSTQTNILGKKRRGGGGTSAAAKSSGV